LSEDELPDLDERITETEAFLLRGFSVASPEQHTGLETKLKRLCDLLSLHGFRKEVSSSKYSKPAVINDTMTTTSSTSFIHMEI
jgi:hypothetical protein